jgi:hypothetical protein
MVQVPDSTSAAQDHTGRGRAFETGDTAAGNRGSRGVLCSEPSAEGRG